MALPELQVNAGGVLQNCDGKYSPTTRIVNGQPVWKKVDPVRWFYSTPNGYWRVTDDVEDFQTGAGYIISNQQHHGTLPHYLTGGWSGCGKQTGEVTVVAHVSPETSPRSDHAACTSVSGAAPHVPLPSYVDLTIQRHPIHPMGLNLKSRGLILVSVDQGSPAEAAGFGEYKGWILESVNGVPVKTAEDIAEATKGVALVTLRIRPPAMEPTLPVEDEELVWIGKLEDEPLGLMLHNMVVVNVMAGSVAAFHGLGAMIGRRLVHVDGVPVRVVADIERLTSGKGSVWLGFAPMTAQESNVISPAPYIRHVPASLEIEVYRYEDDEPLGCYFNGSDNLVLEDVQPETAGDEAGLHRYIGMCLTEMNGEEVTTLADVASIWRGTPPGDTVYMVFEGRRRDRHFPVVRTHSNFQQVYGANHEEEWEEASPADPEYSALWQRRRAAERDAARMPADVVQPASKHGSLRRLALGMTPCAGRPRIPGGRGQTWAPKQKPSRVGPAMS